MEWLIDTEMSSAWKVEFHFTCSQQQFYVKSWTGLGCANSIAEYLSDTTHQTHEYLSAFIIIYSAVSIVYQLVNI